MIRTKALVACLAAAAIVGSGAGLAAAGARGATPHRLT